MTKIRDLHKIWSEDAVYRAEYDALEKEFAGMAAASKAQRHALKVSSQFVKAKSSRPS